MEKKIKDFRVTISFEADYSAEDKDEVFEMIGNEYGLGDVENLHIEIVQEEAGGQGKE